MRKRIIGILALTIFFINSFNVLAKEIIIQLDDTLAWIDGDEYTLTALPKVIDGRTYLPLRFMADQLLEADVRWEGATKEVIITKNERIVQIKIDSKKALSDGEAVELLNPPILDNDSTYLPLRAMAELFEIETYYDERLKRVILTKPEEVDIVIPDPTLFAEFVFEQEEYTQGQTVKEINESYDEDGYAITSQLWMINFNEKQANTRLDKLFLKPKAGTYAVSLKVKNEKGIWSDWVTREITIKPNLKPVVTTLTTSKKSYAGGEELEFTYTYDNEPWENIKAERWTYREIQESVKKAVADKPKFIFHKGEYIVTLQLQDDAGNWSDEKETIVSISEEAKQMELNYRFSSGSIGDIIDNFQDFNYQTYHQIFPDETSYGEGTLLMSDSPEDVKYNGILYRDTVGGTGRILFHHNNMFTEEENQLERKRLVLMAENPTDETVNFVISDKAIKGPAADTLYVGQQLLYDFLKGDGYNRYSLEPGEKMYLYDSQSKNWHKGQLISGKMDFAIDGELTITVAAIGNGTQMDEVESLPELERDVHPRGTYDKTDIYHTIELKDNQPKKLLIGTGPEEWINGYDAITGELVQNRGNYGVTYTLKITAKTETGIILNPRAGVFRGAIKWDGTKTYLTPSKGYFTGHNSKGVMIGTIKAGETRTLEYVLPNGSASPVLFGFIPKEHWDK